MTKLENIQAAIESFSFTAEQSGETIIVRNKKGLIAARVIGDKVEQVKVGMHNLCGALVRNAIVATLKVGV